MDWGWHSMYGVGPWPISPGVILPFVLWSWIWKGLVLWVTARRGQKGWFIFFLIVNTVGILEIIYLLATKGFDELKSKEAKK